MGHQVLMWSLVMMLLLAMFIIHAAIHTLRGHSKHKLFEISDEFSMYDWDDDEV